MTSPYRFGVQTFIEHFRSEGKAIAAVESNLHRKILYCSALDPLARAAQGKTGGHRSRVMHLVLNHTAWGEADRVSLFQLSCSLREKGRTSFPLYSEVKRRLNQSPPRRRMPLAGSPLPSELLPFATVDEVKTIGYHTYASLFYTYRNNLIHEYREPGYGTDWTGSQDVPFYTNLSSFGKRELVFPEAFVRKLFEQALVDVEAYLLKHKINPHSRFEYGSQWRAG